MIQLQKKSGENSDQPVSKFGLENIINQISIKINKIIKLNKRK